MSLNTLDIPSMASHSHTHSTYGGEQMLTGGMGLVTSGGTAASTNTIARQLRDYAVQAQAARPFFDTALITKEVVPMPTRRLVQVYIADTNDNVPLDQTLLYTGEQKLTDATNEELFFEIDMRHVLSTHNERRVKLVNKKIKERTEYLEPAKIRDLKMVVVDLATF